MDKESFDGVLVANGSSVDINQIPVLSYTDFKMAAINLLGEEGHHCLNYSCVKNELAYQFIISIGDDTSHSIKMLSHQLNLNEPLKLTSLAKDYLPLQVFEREIKENFNIDFVGHPWMKPLRFPHDGPLALKTKDYPFFRMNSEETHEVGVGPIHAGVIEPGHFRFSCNGETVIHLEIQLGWQHRGVECLMLNKPTFLARTVLAESIAGDTTIGHTLAFVHGIESLAQIEVSPKLAIERCIALELERIAVHTGNLSAMCTDVAYQFGSSVYGALRTPVINYLQKWCGNRFGKGLIRIGGSHFSITEDLAEVLLEMLSDFEKRFDSISFRTFHLESVLDRFEGIGVVDKKQCDLIGTVGMAARMSGVNRDIRASHPFAAFKNMDFEPSIYYTGDVMARAQVRKDEVNNSINCIRLFLSKWNQFNESTVSKPIEEEQIILGSNMISTSLTEGWRGEILHQITTDSTGKISHYKVKDPSLHNWTALAMALRNLEISDFPINNKSFDLSYCGHDL